VIHFFASNETISVVIPLTKLSRQRLRLNRHRACVSSANGIFGRFLTFCIFRRHQVGIGTEHLKNDIRECFYPGKRRRPDTRRRKPLFRRTYQREKAIRTRHSASLASVGRRAKACKTDVKPIIVGPPIILWISSSVILEVSLSNKVSSPVRLNACPRKQSFRR
jgi:hypothetical protein